MIRSMRILAVVIVIAACLHVAGASADTTRVIDFSTHGGGLLDSRFYKSDGVVFTPGFVGYVQGDDALIGPIAGKFSPKATSVSVRIAPGYQGTATYTLTTYDSARHVVAAASVTVTQDTGDPANSGWGYFTLGLPSLPSNAASFEVTNTFVRSSYPHVTEIAFGVSSVTFTTNR